MPDPFEDELRRSLRAMPEPSAAIDAEQVVLEARRRRRPKIVGVTVTAVAACALVLTPVSIAAVDLLGPGSESTSADGGSQESAPENATPAPGPTDADAPTGGAPPTDDAAPSEQATPGETVESAPGDACSAPPSTSIGLEVAFGDDPSDGVADVTIVNGTDQDVTVETNGLGIAMLADDGSLASTPVYVGDAFSAPVTIAAGSSETLDDLVLATMQSACGGAGDTAAPFVLVLVDTTTDPTETVQVVGEPWQG